MPVPGSPRYEGSIGTPPNLAPGKRMLLEHEPHDPLEGWRAVRGRAGPGGRTIINTVLETIVNVVDFGMNAQEAVDAVRFHHQWLPGLYHHERFAFHRIRPVC